MLEAKHLFKTYKTKKGVPTKALDDVSVTFAEKGMVFILGKSGSGKSTLLNVCGGLDKSDRGEIVIKGRSSADKGDFDFDSYRNTFVGFVFQEYNILEEFTVEENIALALELQHKKRDKEVIAKILADVDMTEFAARKPNTLSGGQKQRVAIARALVKNPEIIMADEPTGALDSNTGKQVFDTLKKLSQDKLVLVVSHDREFAEQYGDRIIEMKDGKIVSDMTREESDADADEKNVRFVGTDTVCVTSGAELTDEDFANIKTFLRKSKGQAVITASRNKVDNITRDLRGGEFNDTAEQPKVREYSAEEKKMIRSRLPMRHAVKMGASSLKSKPVRLVFTILLSVIAFLLFGVASTLMMYDADQVTANAFMDSDYKYINLSKQYYVTEEYYRDGKLNDTAERTRSTNFTMNDLEELQKKYPQAIAAVSLSSYNTFYISNLSLNNNKQSFYTNGVDFIVTDNENLALLAGEHPKESNEVLISEFLFDAMKAGSFMRIFAGQVSDDAIEVKSYQDVLNMPIVIGSASNATTYTITGIFGGENVPEGYAELKTAADGDQSYSGDLRYEWQEERTSGLYSCLAVPKEVFALLQEEFSQNNQREQLQMIFYTYGYASLWYTGNEDADEYGDSSISYLAKFDATGEHLGIYDRNGQSVNALLEKQVALASYAYGNNLHHIIEKHIDSMQGSDDFAAVYDAYYGAYVYEEDENGYPVRVQEAGYRKYDSQTGREIWVPVDCTDREHWHSGQCPNYPGIQLTWRDVQNRGIWDDLEDFKYAQNAQEGLPPLQKINAFIEQYGIDVPAFNNKIVNNETQNKYTVEIVGFMFCGGSSGYIYLSDDMYDELKPSYYSSQWRYSTKYNFPEGAFIGAIFIPYDGSEKLTKDLIKLSGVRDENDACVVIGNSLYESLEFVNEFVGIMSTVFLWTGVVLAAFAFLLMFNFISSSISSKKKEIGILRAIGSRTLDVFKIFLSEALIIALICFVIATVGSWGVCTLINGIMMSESAMFTTGLLLFGPLSVLIIAAIAVVTSVLATTVPVALYSRKPPVASIRAL